MSTAPRRVTPPGYRTCRDCSALFPATGRGASVPWCPDCRTAHLIACRQCRTTFPCDRDGNQTLCACCRDQSALFGTEVTA